MFKIMLDTSLGTRNIMMKRPSIGLSRRTRSCNVTRRSIEDVVLFPQEDIKKHHPLAHQYAYGRRALPHTRSTERPGTRT